MSRSGYSDDSDEGYGLWRGAVLSAMRGKRGQALLRALADALDAMPDKRLGRSAFVDRNNCLCTLGALAAAKGMDLDALDDAADYGDHQAIGDQFDIAVPLAQEIMWLNDEAGHYQETPEQRWQRMRAWVGEHISLA